MWKWIILGSFGLLVIFFVGSFVATYRGLFTVEHYREVAKALEKVRLGAKQHPWVESVEPRPGDIAGPDDPRVALTSRFLAISYSITQGEIGSQHHIAVSTPRAGHTTHAAGQAFISFFVWRLGVEPEQCVSYSGPTSYHVEFPIEEGDEEVFMARPLNLAEGIDLESIRAEIQRIRERIHFFDATNLIEQAEAEQDLLESNGGNQSSDV
jgi:hypothetical protein